MKRLAALLMLYALLVVPAMFARDLWDPDEPRFAQVGREMLRSGDWVIPRMNGEPLALLPPMHCWVSAAAGLPLGDVTPAASRAGSALGGLLALLSVWFLARRWWGDSAACWSCIVLMTSVSFWFQASYSQVDLLLAGFVTAAFAALRVAWEKEDRGFNWFIGGCALCALGTLTKGPVAAVLPGLVFLLLAVAERRRGFLRPAWLAAGLGVYIAIAAPWYLLACHRGGSAFARELLVTHNFGMFFETWSHNQPPWYYLVNVPWAFAPWIVFVPGAMVLSRDHLGGWRQLWWPEERSGGAGQQRFLLFWFLVLFVFFTVAQAKQTKYLLPALPAAAMLVGGYLSQVAYETEKRPRAALGVLAAAGLLVAAFLFLGGVSHIGLKESDLSDASRIARSARAAGAILALGWVASCFAHPPRIALARAAATIALALAASIPVLRSVDNLKSARPICERMRMQMGPGEEAGIYGLQERKIGAFRYYLDQPLATFEDGSEHPDPAKLAAWWARGGPRWLVHDAADPLPESVAAASQLVDSGEVGHRRIEILKRRDVR